MCHDLRREVSKTFETMGEEARKRNGAQPLPVVSVGRYTPIELRA